MGKSSFFYPVNLIQTGNICQEKYEQPKNT